MEAHNEWKPIMIARSCSVTFRDHIEFFEAIHETGRPVNVSGAGGPEDGLVSLSAPFAEILLETHSLFRGASLNILEISPRADIVIPYDFGGGVLGMDYLTDGSYFPFLSLLRRLVKSITINIRSKRLRQKTLS